MKKNGYVCCSRVSTTLYKQEDVNNNKFCIL